MAAAGYVSAHGPTGRARPGRAEEAEGRRPTTGTGPAGRPHALVESVLIGSATRRPRSVLPANSGHVAAAARLTRTSLGPDGTVRGWNAAAWRLRVPEAIHGRPAHPATMSGRSMSRRAVAGLAGLASASQAVTKPTPRELAHRRAA